jgi:hypothetical protein
MKKRSGKGRSDGDTDEAGIEKSMGNKIKDGEVGLEGNDAYYTKQRLSQISKSA